MREHVALSPLLGLMAWWGFISGINGSIAPLLAACFGLDDGGTAGLLAWIGLASLGSLWLGVEADRRGRRTVLLACATALPCAAFGSALAPTPGAYVAAQLVAYAAGGTLLATVSVLLAEALPVELRAAGQSRAGLAFGLATVLPLLVAALVAGEPGGWRVVWGLAALPALALPWLWRALPESRRWSHRPSGPPGVAARTRMGDAFRPGNRQRSILVLAAVALVQGVEFATRTWLFYHPLRVLGMQPEVATPILIAGGGIGLAGFRLGGWLSNRVGRRLAFVWAGGLFALGNVGYFGATPLLTSGRPALLLLCLVLMATAGNAATIAFRSLVSELFPTALRGTLGGWTAVAGSVGWFATLTGAGALAGPAGGVGAALSLVALTAMALAAALLSLLPETAGRELDDPALDLAGAPASGI